MGENKGFLKTERCSAGYRPVCERIKDFGEVGILPDVRHSQEQASRCMDCGTPFCHWGCPIGNYIPEWNDLVFKGRWEDAFWLLQATNNFPEITGRLCPAPCEYACVLEINDKPVSIRDNELAVIEEAFSKGLVRPRPPKKRSGKKIGIVGSGPAGLAAADQLNKAGHQVTVFEQNDKFGGILRYGIPDFKLEKWVIDRRLDILRKEGIEFIAKTNIGKDISMARMKREFSALCLACGSSVPRDLKVEGRDLRGIHFAMDYLVQANKRWLGEAIGPENFIDAKGKKVAIIGGGDTGADCLGVAHRQGAASLVQIELLPKPPERRMPGYPWPSYPALLKTSTSHEEGGKREWSVLTKKFIGKEGRLEKLSCLKVDFKNDPKGCPKMREVSGSEFQIEADMAILALGFLRPQKQGPIEGLGLELDSRGNVKTGENFMTSSQGVFSFGDMHRGQSLVAWAVAEGRQAARRIDSYLMGSSFLPMI